MAERTRLQLMWRNKDQRLLNHGSSTYEWVEPADWRVSEVRLLEEVERVGEPSDNLLIEGDALFALTSLSSIPEYAERYKGKVKLVYIDPPFNTGQTFVSYKDSLENSVWLTMFRDRLRQIKELLAKDGSIWVHLDNEQTHRARLVLDEELGIENYIGTVIWEKKKKPSFLHGQMATVTDNILIYGKQRSAVQPFQIGTSKLGKGFPLNNKGNAFGELFFPAGAVDIDLNDGVVQASDMSTPGIPCELLDDVQVRDGKNVDAFRMNGEWRFSQELLNDEIQQGSRVKIARKPFRPNVVRADVTGKKITNLFSFHINGVPANEDGNKESIKLFGEAFDTPKPEGLLARIIEASTEPGDIVLDCFGGSGTTAAVAHKLGRRWVTVELESKSVDNYIKPRLRAVVDGSDRGGISTTTTETPARELPEGVNPKNIREAATTLTKLLDDGVFDDLPAPPKRKQATPYGQVRSILEENEGVTKELVTELAKQMRVAAKTEKTTTAVWEKGGGFTHVFVGESLFEDVGGVIVLADWAHDGALAQAVAAQLRFPYKPEAPFAGRKGRQRLAVIDGMLTESLVDYLLGYTEDTETLVVVAQSLSLGVGEYLRKQRKGSRARKVPRDLAHISQRTERVVLSALPIEGVSDE